MKGEVFMPVEAFLHSHVASWALLLVTFALAWFGYKNGGKIGKIAHMSYRLFMVLVLVTGVLFYLNIEKGDIRMYYDIKMTLAIVSLFIGEMTLVRTKKKRPTGLLFAAFLILILATIFLGYALPYGQAFFNGILFG